MTALLSGIGCAFFALSMKVLGRKDPVLAGLALGFVPVVYIYSTMSVDSVWALAFTLAALYFVLVRRSLLAGVALGMAIGCRITSGAMLIPLALLLAMGQPKREALRAMLRFSGVAGIVGVAAFAPVVAKYRWSWLTFYELMGYPPWRDVVQLATVDVWGSFGFVGLLVALASFAFTPNKFRAIRLKPMSNAGLLSATCVLVIALYAIAYLRLPHQSKYLIPILPFIILLLNGVLDRRVFVFVCCMLIASPFVTIGRAGMHAGLIFSDHAARRRDMELVEEFISRANDLRQEAVIVAGPWLPKIHGALLERPQGIAEYVHSLDASELQRRLSQGSTVYYLPEMEKHNAAATGIDLANFGAQPLLATDSGDLGTEHQ